MANDSDDLAFVIDGVGSTPLTFECTQIRQFELQTTALSQGAGAKQNRARQKTNHPATEVLHESSPLP